MIRYTSKKGKQTITAICNKCKCEIKGLTVADIIVKKPNQSNKIYDSNGDEITRTELEYLECTCDDCKDD